MNTPVLIICEKKHRLQKSYFPKIEKPIVFLESLSIKKLILSIEREILPRATKVCLHLQINFICTPCLMTAEMVKLTVRQKVKVLKSFQGSDICDLERVRCFALSSDVVHILYTIIWQLQFSISVAKIFLDILSRIMLQKLNLCTSLV